MDEKRYIPEFGCASIGFLLRVVSYKISLCPPKLDAAKYKYKLES